MQRCKCGYELIDGMQRCSECGRPRGPAQIDAVVPGWLMYVLAANALVVVGMVLLVVRWEAMTADEFGPIAVGFAGLVVLANLAAMLVSGALFLLNKKMRMPVTAILTAFAVFGSLVVALLSLAFFAR
jgi:hypothetical protein